MAMDPFSHLETRCNVLIAKYLEPVILAENEALKKLEPLPAPDFDSLAAFKLLAHAELEGYFEAKAALALQQLDSDFKSNRISSSNFAALIFLYMQKKQVIHNWSSIGKSDDKSLRDAERKDIATLAQEALGFGRQFIKANNGIKENSVLTLSALMGYFESDIDSLLIEDLNEFGKSRGGVAHDSWTKDTSVFDSAELQKKHILKILKATNDFYEKSSPVITTNNKLSIKQKLYKLLRFKS